MITLKNYTYLCLVLILPLFLLVSRAEDGSTSGGVDIKTEAVGLKTETIDTVSTQASSSKRLVVKIYCTSIWDQHLTVRFSYPWESAPETLSEFLQFGKPANLRTKSAGLLTLLSSQIDAKSLPPLVLRFPDASRLTNEYKAANAYYADKDGTIVPIGEAMVALTMDTSGIPSGPIAQVMDKASKDEGVVHEGTDYLKESFTLSKKGMGLKLVVFQWSLWAGISLGIAGVLLIVAGWLFRINEEYAIEIGPFKLAKASAGLIAIAMSVWMLIRLGEMISTTDFLFKPQPFISTNSVAGLSPEEH